MASLELIGVSKSYARGSRAVNDVSLSVEAGELLVLVGPSGCGKSTLLRMIAGLESVSEGEIRIDGRAVQDVEPKHRDVAMVFQNYALYPHMSVFENMAFGLRLRGRPDSEIDTKVRETAAFLELSEKLARKPRELSGGERQRVALGRALVRNPKIFLFDEPLSNLDARLRVQMRAQIHRLHRELSATMVYVTHDQVEAMTLGDRIAVLERGFLRQMADPATLYGQPADRFVAGFIGSPPMNFVTVRVAGNGGAGLADGVTVLEAGAPATLAEAGELVMGVRPEDFTIGGNGSGAKFDATLELCESLGHEVVLHWKTSAGMLVSRHAGTTGPPVGERVRLVAPVERIHWFDATTGHART